MNAAFEETAESTDMIPEIMAIAVGALWALYLFIRLSSRFSGRDETAEIIPTNAGKIYHSKVHDTGFFDGESEDYAEAMNRMRPLGK